MLFNESGLIKQLKAAYKVGYEIIPNGSRVTICTRTWAIDADRVDVPLKASLAMVEHAGYMPSMPIKVVAGSATQIMLAETAKVHIQEASTGSEGDWQVMKKLPIVYKEHWQLYIAENGAVYAFDTAILDIMDTNMVTPTAMLRTGYCPAGVFEQGGNYLMVAPSVFSITDSAKMLEIAKMNWDNVHLCGDPCENLSLFDMEDEE